MQVAMLGPLEVRDGAGSPREVSGTRLRALLELLALRAGDVVPPSSLIDELWGERLPADALNALQALVSRLRRAIGDPSAVGSGPAGYQLKVDRDDIDVFRFERLAARGRAALSARPDEAAGLLGQALALWRGEPLPDAAETETGRAAIARLTELRLAAAEDRADAELRLGGPGQRLAELVAELEGLLAVSPTRETLVGLLMRALAADGRRGAALQVYERTRERLADQLGADPSPPLAALHLELLRADGRPAPVARVPGATTATAVTATAVPQSPAVPQSRGLPSAPGGPDDRGPGAARDNLPAALTSFLGREGDLDEVGALLGEHRLVTLTGPGGAGKTRLAVEAARAALTAAGTGSSPGGALPGGVWLAELAPVTDPADVAATVLSALGVREQALLLTRPPRSATGNGAAGGGDADEALDRLVGALAGRQALLVLDNCEHLIAAAAGVADRVLARCPGMRVLATSREPLNITGEALWPVGPLAESPAERLFAERAAAVSPGFRLTAENSAAVSRICQALDGMPLAIELAAARTRTMTPAQIADRLDQRFRLLTAGSRTVLPRHQTLRAVVDWSWDLLDDTERALLRRLSVFTGGATLEAAEQVCATGPVAGDDVHDLLTALADKSLLTVRQTRDGPRYLQLETIREYGRERLAEAGEAEALRRRHAGYFLRVAEEAQPLLFGADQLEWLRRLVADADNVHTAIRAAVAADAMDAAVDDPFPWVGGLARVLRGQIWLNQGRMIDRAEADFRAAVTMFEEIGERWGLAMAVSGLAQIEEWRDDLAAAAAHYEHAAGLAGELGTTEDETQFRLHLARVLWQLGGADRERSRAEVARALRDAERLGWPEVSAYAGYVSGNLARLDGDFATARRQLDRAGRIAETQRGALGQITAVTFTALAYLAAAEGDLGAARSWHDRALAVALPTGDAPVVAEVLTGLADVALRREDAPVAATLLGAAEGVRGTRNRSDDDSARVTAATRAALGTADYGAAFARGQRVTLDTLEAELGAHLAPDTGETEVNP